MIGEIIQTTTGSYVKCATDSRVVSSERDVLDLLAYCGQASTDNILLEQAFLHPNFFDLSTKLAGDIFHKLTTYRIKTAIVANLSEIKSERFQELIFECNKGNQINFFDDLSTAEQWLTTGQ